MFSVQSFKMKYEYGAPAVYAHTVVQSQGPSARFVTQRIAQRGDETLYFGFVGPVRRPAPCILRPEDNIHTAFICLSCCGRKRRPIQITPVAVKISVGRLYHSGNTGRCSGRCESIVNRSSAGHPPAVHKHFAHERICERGVYPASAPMAQA